MRSYRVQTGNKSLRPLQLHVHVYVPSTCMAMQSAILVFMACSLSISVYKLKCLLFFPSSSDKGVYDNICPLSQALTRFTLSPLIPSRRRLYYQPQEHEWRWHWVITTECLITQVSVVGSMCTMGRPSMRWHWVITTECLITQVSVVGSMCTVGRPSMRWHWVTLQSA